MAAAAARKTNDANAGTPEAQPAPSSPPAAAEQAAPAVPTRPAPPTCPRCRSVLELYVGENPHKVGQGFCGPCGKRMPLEAD